MRRSDAQTAMILTLIGIERAGKRHARMRRILPPQLHACRVVAIGRQLLEIEIGLVRRSAPCGDIRICRVSDQTPLLRVDISDGRSEVADAVVARDAIDDRHERADFASARHVQKGAMRFEVQAIRAAYFEADVVEAVRQRIERRVVHAQRELEIRRGRQPVRHRDAMHRVSHVHTTRARLERVRRRTAATKNPHPQIHRRRFRCRMMSDMQMHPMRILRLESRVFDDFDRILGEMEGPLLCGKWKRGEQ
jgi:hypothetical protein